MSPLDSDELRRRRQEDAHRSYYEDELRHLRQRGIEFSKQYPSLARSLNLPTEIAGYEGQAADPFVERLLQGTAFLTARLQQRLDDDIPEFTQPFLELLYPHLAAPTPGVALARFAVDDKGSGLTKPFRIKAGTELRPEALDRSADHTPALMRTSWDAHLVPLRIRDAEIRAPDLGRTPEYVRAILTFKLEILGNATFEKLGLEKLRIHLGGEESGGAELLELLTGTSFMGAEYSWNRGDQIERVRMRSSDDPRPVEPVGFAPEDGLFPYPPEAFLGYRILHEYFVLPRKFLFIDLQGLDRLPTTQDTHVIQVDLWLGSEPARGGGRLREEALQLGCVPVVNLFEQRCEEVIMRPGKTRFLITPQHGRRNEYEVYRVTSVKGRLRGRQGAEVQLAPFHGFRESPDGLFWSTKRTLPFLPTERGKAAASEVWLTVTGSEGNEDALEILLPGGLRGDREQAVDLEILAWCSNADHANAQLMAGQAMVGHEGGSIACSLLTKPTVSKRGFLLSTRQWQLISHLQINFLSLVGQDPAERASTSRGGDAEDRLELDGGQVAARRRSGEALRGLLRLYSEPGATRFERMIHEGVDSVRSERTTSILRGAVVRGVRVTIVLKRDAFEGHGISTFAHVLDRFLGVSASLNSFCELQIAELVGGEEQPRFQFRPRSGMKTLS